MRWFAVAAVADGVTVRDISDDDLRFRSSRPACARDCRTHNASGCLATTPSVHEPAASWTSAWRKHGSPASPSPASSASRSTCPAVMHRAPCAKRCSRPARISAWRKIGFNALNCAAAGKELRHLVARIHPGLYAGQSGLDRFIAFDKGDFIGREAALDGARRRRRQAKPGHARGRCCRRRRLRLRAGLAWRTARRLRHLGRLWPHGRQEPGAGLVDKDVIKSGAAPCRRRHRREPEGEFLAEPAYDPKGTRLRA